jgi:hypothetical protein
VYIPSAYLCVAEQVRGGRADRQFCTGPLMPSDDCVASLHAWATDAVQAELSLIAISDNAAAVAVAAAAAAATVLSLGMRD